MYLRRRLALLVVSSLSSIVAVVFALTVAAVFVYRSLDNPWLLRVAVGPAGSADAEFAGAIQHIAHELGFRRADLVQTDSASSAAAALEEHRAHVAIVRSDVAFPQHAGTVLVVHKDVAVTVAAPGVKVAALADL